MCMKGGGKWSVGLRGCLGGGERSKWLGGLNMRGRVGVEELK